MSERRGSMGEQRESISTKRALAGEQSGEALVSRRSRIALSSGYIYIYIGRVLIILSAGDFDGAKIQTNIRAIEDRSQPASQPPAFLRIGPAFLCR